MRAIKDLVGEFVKRPVVSMPPAVSVAKVRELCGHASVVKMCSNENPLGVSPKAAEAMMDEIRHLSLYADPEPEEALKAKVAASIGVTPQHVVMTSGASFALNTIGEVFIQPGDEAILCSPTYPPYYSIIHKNGGTVIDVPQTDKLEYDFDRIVKAITRETKVIFICNPNNPTGGAVYRENLLKLANRVPEDVILAIDEAYVQFARDPEAMTMVPAIADRRNIVVVQTFSKLYGLAGIRIGYAVSTPEIITYMQRESTARSLNMVGIRGAFAALDDAEFAGQTMANNAAGRTYLTEQLTALDCKVYPSESNFVYVDFGADPQELTGKLLPYGIIVRGDFACVRISIGTAGQNERLIGALKAIR